MSTDAMSCTLVVEGVVPPMSPLTLNRNVVVGYGKESCFVTAAFAFTPVILHLPLLDTQFKSTLI